MAGGDKYVEVKISLVPTGNGSGFFDLFSNGMLIFNTDEDSGPALNSWGIYAGAWDRDPLTYAVINERGLSLTPSVVGIITYDEIVKRYGNNFTTDRPSYQYIQGGEGTTEGYLDGRLIPFATQYLKADPVSNDWWFPESEYFAYYGEFDSVSDKYRYHQTIFAKLIDRQGPFVTANLSADKIYEGGDNLSATLTLSEILTYDVTVKFFFTGESIIAPDDLDMVLEKTIKAGQKTITIENFLHAFADRHHEKVEKYHVSYSAEPSDSTKTVYAGPDRLVVDAVDVLVGDDMLYVIENPGDDAVKTAFARVLDAKAIALSALIEGLSIKHWNYIAELRIQEAFDEASNANIVKKLGHAFTAFGVALDVGSHSRNLNAALNAADRLEIPLERQHARYEAFKTYRVEMTNTVIKTAWGLATGEATALAIALIPAAIVAGPLVAGLVAIGTVGAGVGAILLYEEFEPTIKAALAAEFDRDMERFYNDVEQPLRLNFRQAPEVQGPNTYEASNENDVFTIDNAADRTFERVDGGRDIADASVEYKISDNIEILRLFGDARRGTGNASDNLIVGNDAASELFGEAGSDILVSKYTATFDGGSGADVFLGYYGKDTATYIRSPGGVTVDLAVGAGFGADAEGDTLSLVDNVVGSAFKDKLTGDYADNVLSGEGGDDSVAGGDGFDSLFGGGGNDTLDGGANPNYQGDILIGGLGNDVYHVDSPLDLVDEGIVFGGAAGGVDEIILQTDFFWDFYSAGDVLRIAETAVDPQGDGTTAVGSVFSNFMVGNSKTNVLFGRGGSDTYIADDGIDFISLSTLGLNDQNAYVGVNGVNTVIVERRSSGPNSYDIVFEFESGKDKLDVSDYGFASRTAAFAKGVNDGAGNSYFVLGDGFDYLYMVGLELSELTASDFIV